MHRIDALSDGEHFSAHPPQGTAQGILLDGATIGKSGKPGDIEPVNYTSHARREHQCPTRGSPT